MGDAFMIAHTHTYRAQTMGVDDFVQIAKVKHRTNEDCFGNVVCRMCVSSKNRKKNAKDILNRCCASHFVNFNVFTHRIHCVNMVYVIVWQKFSI